MGRAVATDEQPAEQPALSTRSRIRRALLETIPASSAAYRRHEARLVNGSPYEVSAERALGETGSVVGHGR